MNEIVLNWARARKGIYVLYIFILVLPVSMGLLQKSISIFLAPSLAFSIIFYYLHARVRLAEAERWSIAPNASTADFFSLFSKLIGGVGKFFILVIAGTFSAIFVVVASSVL